MQHRKEIVRLRDSERLSERRIAQRLEIPASTVHYWLAKEDKPKQNLRRGRPRVTSAEDDTRLYSLSVQQPFRSAVDLLDATHLPCSVDTVRNRLKERGLRCRVPARKPFLTDLHIEKRLTFAHTYRFWGPTDWGRVLFSDEKIFRSSSTGRLRVYRPRRSNRFDKQYIHLGPKSRTTVCVWMTFGWRFKAIHRVGRYSLNGEYYTNEILTPIIKPYFDKNRDKNYIFQQDLSSIHTSGVSKHWFESNNVPWMEDWPPKGPDMNPVENVWGEIVRRIRHNPTNEGQLWENVRAAFRELDFAYFRNLIRSMRTRMLKVIAAEGRWTKY